MSRKGNPAAAIDCGGQKEWWRQVREKKRELAISKVRYQSPFESAADIQDRQLKQQRCTK